MGGKRQGINNDYNGDKKKCWGRNAEGGWWWVLLVTIESPKQIKGIKMRSMGEKGEEMKRSKYDKRGG